MPSPTKRDLLAKLEPSELRALAKFYGVRVNRNSRQARDGTGLRDATAVASLPMQTDADLFGLVNALAKQVTLDEGFAKVLTFARVRDLCTAFNLDNSGKKPELIARLTGHPARPRERIKGALENLSNKRLGILCDAFALDRTEVVTKDDLVDLILRTKRIGFEEILGRLLTSELKSVCRTEGLDDTGDETALIARILGRVPLPPVAAPADPPAPTPPPVRSPALAQQPGRLDDMTYSRIISYIWGIADDCLRDLYVRGKYRDVILPMTVIRRLDAVLESTKQAVLDMKVKMDKAGVANQDRPLRKAAGQAFYNTSQFTLRDLKNRVKQGTLKADFEAYLDGFSPNVQTILENFEFRNQIPRLTKADVLGTLIEKLLDPTINLSPSPVLNADGTVKQPGLDNHAMGTIFEELVRRFNEENNEEAGEHWTPRDAVKLMARLIFLPIADQLESSTYLLYDGACGTGGMLTVGEETLKSLAAKRGLQVVTHLYGQEINAETYAIAKADFLLKGEGDEADNLIGGPEHSTLANDAFPGHEFDFMLSNPPYGKSWKSDQERMGGKDELRDPRFVIAHGGDPEYSMLTRSSDGQMLFLVNLLSKMKNGSKLGSRIAEVHNGSSLFTGDAGQGESNIRRWILENDWLEAIVALPLNMFYNTGIATYIWVLTNRKPAHRRGRVQLIDATGWFKPLRKNLGKKNCELSEEDIARICDAFLAFEETEQSKIFPNAAFGYSKVTVEQPLRIRGIDPEKVYSAKEIKELKATGVVDEAAPAVIKKLYKGITPDPLRGLFPVTIAGKRTVVEYEPDPDLRDTEQVPLLEEGGIPAFLQREVLPHAPDAWFNEVSVRIGYEISFTRYFYKPQPLRSLEEIRADIQALERETDGLLAEIIGGGN